VQNKSFAVSRGVHSTTMFVNYRFKRNCGIEAVTCATHNIRPLNMVAGTAVAICQEENGHPLAQDWRRQ